MRLLDLLKRIEWEGWFDYSGIKGCPECKEPSRQLSYGGVHLPTCELKAAIAQLEIENFFAGEQWTPEQMASFKAKFNPQDFEGMK